jgi:hypothetical protein
MEKTIEIQETKSKILDIDKLPSYHETIEFLDLIEQRGIKNPYKKILGWFYFCSRNNLFNIYNIEFIDALADEIKKLNKSPIIEICAGNGKLSHHLRKKNIDIIATDDYSWKLSNENLVAIISMFFFLKW